VPVPISIIVCTRNRLDSLRRCVKALFEVSATCDWELVIVNNGSDDGTKNYLESLPKKFNKVHVVTLLEEEPGLAAARNCGWRTARGELIAFTDDDCYVRNDYVDQLIALFSEHSELGFIGGRILLYDKTDLRETILEDEEFLYLKPFTFIAAGTISGANMAFRKSTLERIGGFDEALGAGTRFPSEDIDAFATALWSGIPGAYDPRPTVFHHHGRKTLQDVHDLWLGYDWGRGAYFTKFILNPKSRGAYINAWAKSVKTEVAVALADLVRHRRIPRLTRPRRELWAGLQYLLSRSRSAKIR
jgi:glycosyltransferase involved in cell wall biosynthesis